MLKKLLISSVILSASHLALAANSYPGKAPAKRDTAMKSYKADYHTSDYNNHKASYKGELSTLAPLPYKAPAAEFTPCITSTITPGPYLGLNPGLRTNYNETASVYKAFEGTAFAGYAMLSSSFYLAGELFLQRGAQLQNYRNNINSNLNPVGLKTTWGGGLSLLPGYLLADTLMGYLRLGSVLTHFQDSAENTLGGQIGIGLEGAVSESWDLRAEYIYSFYQSMTSLGSPRSDQFRVGILYRLWT